MSGAELGVFLDGEELATLERRGPSRYRFAYGSEALASWDEGEVVLSASLPVRREVFAPAKAAPFFEGLLPEGVVRAEIARRFGLSQEDGFGLLRELGAECAGAVVILPAGEVPRSGVEEVVQPLAAAELETMIEELPRRPLGVSAEPDGVRLSLGGVQDKLVLRRLSSTQFGLPRDGTPSDCLLKPDYGRHESLAANEAFCMRVAAASGLETARTEVVTIGPTPCLYVKRFDRTVDDAGHVRRLHQEDMCQALGILPAAKYEENGGPSVATIVDLLRTTGSARAALDVNTFVKAVLVNFLLGNSDAHGKNFALSYDPAVGVRLAPLYDVVSTAVYPELTERMAMRVGGIEDPEDVDLDAWKRLASESGLGGQISTLVRVWTDDVVAHAETLCAAARAEGWHRPVIDAIVETCRRRAGQLIG